MNLPITLKMHSRSIKTILIFFFISVGSSVFAQDKNWALGLKVGEPIGLNIRKYFRDNERAFDVNIGSFGFMWGAKRTRGKDDELIYDGAGIMFQGIYNFYKTLGRNDNVGVYYGFGGQANSRNRPSTLSRDQFRVVSFGPAVNAGIQVDIPDNDLDVFLEIGGYGEIAPKPFFLALNGALGLRLNVGRK
ncbi:MAG: hypothetical protein ACRCVT_07360 [Leadbetterella sp.]